MINENKITYNNKVITLKPMNAKKVPKQKLLPAPMKPPFNAAIPCNNLMNTNCKYYIYGWLLNGL